MLVEALPKLVDGRSGRFGTDIEQNAHVRLDQRAKRVEEPSVTIELLLVLLLQTEDDLNRAGTLRNFASLRNDHT